MFRNFENFARALDSHPSPMHGLDFCHGCRSEMRGGAGVLDAIDYLGRRGRLFYLYLRDAVGRAQDFTECFINEGNSDVFAVMMKLITDHRLPTADCRGQHRLSTRQWKGSLEDGKREASSLRSE